MDVRILRLLVAAPLVVLLGAAMALAASLDGDVTARDQEVVARLTRGGVQRFDAEGGHWTADANDGTGAGAPWSAPAPNQQMMAAGPGLLPHLAPVTMLDTPAAGPRTGRLATPPSRGRAPPRR